MRIVLTILFIISAIEAFAVDVSIRFSSDLTADFQLEEGLYYPNEDFICAYRIRNNLVKNEIYLIGININGSPCGNADPGTGIKVASNTYHIVYPSLVGPISQEFIDQCQPRSSSPTPCPKVMYGLDGKLVIQVGDEYVVGIKVELLSSKAFKASGYLQICSGKSFMEGRKVNDF